LTAFWSKKKLSQSGVHGPFGDARPGSAPIGRVVQCDNFVVKFHLPVIVSDCMGSDCHSLRVNVRPSTYALYRLYEGVKSVAQCVNPSPTSNKDDNSPGWKGSSGSVE
jgi:hypothetical protein